jgi:hypothetical protein
MFNKMVLGFLAVVVIVSLSLATLVQVDGTSEKTQGFEERRGQVLSGLTEAIEQAEKEGKYECCIEPACTMCYLENFIWDNGECHCDNLIAEGKEPCPQCSSGTCDANAKSCEIDI